MKINLYKRFILLSLFLVLSTQALGTKEAVVEDWSPSETPGYAKVCPEGCRNKHGLPWTGKGRMNENGRLVCKCGMSLYGDCKEPKDCEEYGPVGHPGVSCCKGKCQDKVKDWFGNYYCKDDCVGQCTQTE